ncbi:beta-mannosidase [Persicobacter psychrovividus]
MKMLLSQNWTLQQLGKEATYPSKVPSEVHLDLLNAGIIPDPFYGTNEDSVQWVSQQDWVYKTTFNLEDNWMDFEQIALTCEGLDTYAAVVLNGHQVITSKNMFVGHQADVKQYLKKGENKLEITFQSPLKAVKAQHDALNYEYPASNDAAEEKLSVFTRKAPYQYGWDWGPRLVTMGIFRPISLRAYNHGEIRDLHFQPQLNADESAATVHVDVEVHAVDHEFGEIEIYDQQGQLVGSVGEKLQKGTNHLSTDFKVENPVLWWPNGLGQQHLYEYTAKFKMLGKTVDTQSEKIGFRTIEVVNEPDSLGESFFVKVNGKPVFMKGTNYIPQDNILPRVQKQDYVNMLTAAKEANNNMIRVWGGGIYENDQFYDLCDSLGLLVWQDFMFACTIYPGDADFLQNVKEEAAYNIKRIRNHASLALWCGNNEVQVGWDNWGWHSEFGYTPEDSVKLYKDYEKLFKEVLPEMVDKYDAGRFYYPSSPISNWGDIKDFAIGDNHYWGVWWGKKPFESFNEYVPRFMSEFGFQSFPIMSSIKRFSEEKDWQLDSPVMNTHQKSSIGNITIQEYMQRDYQVPSSFSDFVYVSQILQGHGMQIGMEAQRRNMPFCMGSLVWQLNDVWPAASWSAIDYYGKRKAFYFTMQRAFAPQIISTETKGDQLDIYLVSDLLEKDQGKLTLNWVDFKGKILKSEDKAVKIGAQTSTKILTVDAQLPKGMNPRDTFLKMVYTGTHGTIEKVHYFTKVKDLSLPKANVLMKVKKVSEGFEVTLRSEVLAKDVYVDAGSIDGTFNDNFFDLLPNTPHTILFRTKEDQVKFSTTSIRDTY